MFTPSRRTSGATFSRAIFAIAAVIAGFGASSFGKAPIEIKVVPSPAMAPVAVTAVTQSLFGGPPVLPTATPIPTALSSVDVAGAALNALPQPRPPRSDRIAWTATDNSIIEFKIASLTNQRPELHADGDYLVGATRNGYLYDAALPDFKTGAVIVELADP